MKFITIHHPKLGFAMVQFSPHISHHEMLAALGDPKCAGAGFVTLPDTIVPKVVGHSTSLGLGPTTNDRLLIESGYELTGKQYPYAPLFSSDSSRS